MSFDRAGVQARVIAIVADALAVDEHGVHAHSSLVDDLGAESIDFLDIQFRIESAFDISIPEEELWSGLFSARDQDAIDAGVRQLRARMPEFRWDRLPDPIRRVDLPRLITIRTIVDYLERRSVDLPAAGGAA